ncbi:hypothetical protein M407DRAFT_27963 [Tulasnella calospora MUT 4182]|uniref:Retrotransposon gag domain-containing protein n=1 Tax=Tulasnella calospora MUT 4182 TaxID=1051891 RepID=A0A0C3QBM1_9AGAM|nr:hypothetical protein M407DRAFT_27963 [Tulasnella calospora MUT 4182]
MSDTTEVPDVVFNGKDGKECEAFVAAIQAFAFSKRWDEDYQWILRFAKSCLRGKALRWYAKLDPTIKKDWDLFVQALFDEYPAVEDPDDGGKATPVWSATTFSPSPSTITLSANPELDPNATKPSLLFGPVMPNTQMGHEPCHFPHSCNQHTYPARKYDASSAKQQIGLLRIVNEDEIGIPQYIWWDSPVEENIRSRETGYSFSFWKTVTLNRHEALIVSFLPSSVPHQIGCLNSRRALRNLAVRWHHGPDAEYGFFRVQLNIYKRIEARIHPDSSPCAAVPVTYHSVAKRLVATGTSQKSGTF